ncbi:MAG: dihydrofolate reductase [Phycisphaerales bacterium]
MARSEARTPRVSIIVAMSDDRVIGRAGDMPWRLSNDLKRFKRLTTGHPVLMGRKTWESIGRPLPNRRNLIITRNASYTPAGANEVEPPTTVEVAGSLDEAMTRARGDSPEGIDAGEIFIIGGGEIYRQALARTAAPRVSRIHLTRIHTTLDAREDDTRFPELDTRTEWRLVESSERHEPDERNDFAHTFEIWERVAE